MNESRKPADDTEDAGPSLENGPRDGDRNQDATANEPGREAHASAPANAATEDATADMVEGASKPGADPQAGEEAAVSSGDDRAAGDDQATVSGGGGSPPAGMPARAKSGGDHRGGGKALMLATIAMLLAIGAAGFGGYLFQRLHDLEERLAAVPDQREQAIGAAVDRVDVRDELDRIAARVDQQTAARDELAADFSARLGTLADQLAEIRELAVGHHAQWRLAEVRYLLEIGIRRLQLAEDRAGAVAAFEAADDALHRLGDARVLPLRQAIVEDVARIRELERPDVEGIALRLLNLERATGRLPLAAEPAAAPIPDLDIAAGSFWEGLLERLRGLVVIRHRAAEPEPAPEVDATALPPAEALGHNLRQARLAALNGDADGYGRALAQAREVLGTAFAEEDERVERFDQRLRELSGRSVRVEVPDFTPTLDRMADIMTRIDASRREARIDAVEPEAAEPAPDTETEEGQE